MKKKTQNTCRNSNASHFEATGGNNLRKGQGFEALRWSGSNQGTEVIGQRVQPHGPRPKARGPAALRPAAGVSRFAAPQPAAPRHCDPRQGPRPRGPRHRDPRHMHHMAIPG